ncbi:MAG: hypothetical protein RXQ72_03755 [Hydrogenobaculum sp.]
MLKSEGYILNRFYLLEAEETEALTKIVQVYLKSRGLVTLYVRDIYVDSNFFGKLELFDKVNIWWESAKDLANLVDIIDYKRNKNLYSYENYMGLSYISKAIKEDIKLYDEYVYRLLEFFWSYDFGKNFYIPVLWFLINVADYFGFRPLFLDKDFSKSPNVLYINLQDGDIGMSKYSMKVRKHVLEFLKIISNTDLENIGDVKMSISDAKEGTKFMMRLFRSLNR